MRRYVQILSLISLLLCVQSQLPPDQKTTMKNLYEILKNDTQISWNPTNDPCSWKGVNCTSTLNQSFITQLSLSSLSLSNIASLPVMCHLSTLETVDVSDNLFTSIPDGFITGCGNISGLRVLNFSRNLLVGNLPTFIGFENLEKLDLSQCSLNGSINSQLKGLNSLKLLNLGMNQFSGSLPVKFGENFVLEELYLSLNKFHGEIPKEIANYLNLATIDLSENRLFGSLPDRVRELLKLETLVLSSNNLTGEIPNFLSSIKTMKRFAANNNRFLGTLPSGLTNFLNNLDLSFNNLSGSIPFDLLSQPNLQMVDLSENSLVGLIPGNISSSLVRLRLGGNLLSGKIPSLSFENARNLTYLELENNDLVGSIPQGLSLCKELALLNLANNELGGILPIEFGNLSNLQELKLQDNKFTGEIPILITKLHSLRKLNMNGNLLNGSIPSSISNLQNLTYLDLSCNKLSGSIPGSISNLNSLIELELGNNKLSGEIPLMPQNLQIGLNLSNNLFQGRIPEELSKLTHLEVLDFSKNRFSGQIPRFLASMATLTILELSNNLLSGLVPEFPSYIFVNTSGNKDLIYATKSLPPPPHKRKPLTIMITILIVVAVVVAVGMVTILAIFIPKCYHRQTNQQIESHEEFSQPEILRGAILTRNPFHRSNIDFSKAMGSVIDPSNIVLKTKFSTYYKAKMPSGSNYFLKKLDMFRSDSYDRFAEEFQILSKLSNTNIMTPLAYALTVDSSYIFYEYSLMGTLFDALHYRNMGNSLDWMSRYSIAIGVAQGLAYLHGYGSEPILLLDLSSTSVLLRSHKEPRIGDIELWKVIDPMKNTTSLSAVAGSVGYIPPEYAYKMRVTTEGNVYSLGVILLELLTGRQAVSQGVVLAKWAPLVCPGQHKDLDHILDNEISRTSLAVKKQMLAVLKVALACVNDSPDARPNTKTIVRMLLNAR